MGSADYTGTAVTTRLSAKLRVTGSYRPPQVTSASIGAPLGENRAARFRDAFGARLLPVTA